MLDNRRFSCKIHSLSSEILDIYHIVKGWVRLVPPLRCNSRKGGLEGSSRSETTHGTKEAFGILAHSSGIESIIFSKSDSTKGKEDHNLPSLLEREGCHSAARFRGWEGNGRLSWNSRRIHRLRMGCNLEKHSMKREYSQKKHRVTCESSFHDANPLLSLAKWIKLDKIFNALILGANHPYCNNVGILTSDFLRYYAMNRYFLLFPRCGSKCLHTT
jgi:hypothetical protein